MHAYILMSVRLRNFEDGGSWNAGFLPGSRHAEGNFFGKDPTMTYSSSKSAKIVLSESIFYVKNRRNFFKKKIHLRISI